MSVERARAYYLDVIELAPLHVVNCSMCRLTGRFWLEVDAASIVLDLAAAMADRERTLQLAGVDDASSKAPRQG